MSSGAAFAMTMNCLAPDVFAGVGMFAGPSVGTSSNGVSTKDVKESTVEETKSRCETLAGSYSYGFSNQIFSIAYGSADEIVNLGYNIQNANAMAQVYDRTGTYPDNTYSTSPLVTETLWTQGRVSLLELDGLGHAWAAGDGASGTYISGSHINYALYLGNYFMTYNRRVMRTEGYWDFLQ